MDNLTARLLGENFEEALKELHDPKSPYAIPFFFQCSAQTLAVVIRELHAGLRMAKAEGAAEAYDDIRAQAEDLRKEGGIRASLLRLLAEECVSSAAAIRKGIEAKEGK